MHNRSSAWARAVALIAFLASLYACEIPTAAPILETRWVFPVRTTTIGIDEFLPDGVVATDAGFEVEVNPFSRSMSLGDLCSLCQALNGILAPKPLLQTSFDASSTLAQDLVSAELTSGAVTLQLFNGFGFDPLRPSATATGTLTITLIAGDVGGRVLDQVILDGASTSMPPGSTTTLPRSLAPGALTSTVTALVELDSPAGDPVQIDTSDRLDLIVTVESLSIASATLDVAGREVTIEDTSLEMDGIDSTLLDYLMSGALELEIQNPFGIAMNMFIEIRGPGITTIRRDFDVTDAPTSIARLEYEGEELRSFLGKPGIVFAGSGVVSSAAGTTTVTPGQELVIDASLDAVLEIGR